MSTALERLKLLMGGEEAFKKAEADAANLQNDESQHQSILIESNGTTAPQLGQELTPDTVARHESIRKRIKSNVSSDVNKYHWCSSLRRAQLYLGLREPNQEDAPAQDPTQPPPYDPHLDPIILSLDIEADETNHNTITEIGISLLDTRHLKNLPPGPAGQTWHSQIHSHHLRITEHTHIRNHIFVSGNPESFNPTFGSSELVPLSQIADTIRGYFHQEDPSSNSLRNILLIGHSIKSDIAWLRDLDVDLLDIPDLIEVLDTEDLQKALKRDSQGGTSLARLLEEVGIVAVDLHNAGNDAAYTLQAFVAVVLKSVARDRPVVGLEERIREAIVKATERVTAEWKAWDVAEKRKDGDQPVAYRSSRFRG